MRPRQWTNRRRKHAAPSAKDEFLRRQRDGAATHTVERELLVAGHSSEDHPAAKLIHPWQSNCDHRSEISRIHRSPDSVRMFQ
jgi:hypothetical protein